MKKIPGLIEKALLAAELPASPKKIIGGSFLFIHGDHFIGGTIRSIGYGPSEGVLLYVTTPRFRGVDIRRICRRNGALVLQGFATGEYIEGEFILL